MSDETDIAATLAPRQIRAVSALLIAPSVDAASQTCGVPARTLWTWLRDDAFRAALDEAKGALAKAMIGEQAIGETAHDLAAMRHKAIAVLADCLEAPRHADKIKAARTILELSDTGNQWFQEMLTTIDGMKTSDATECIANLISILEARLQTRQGLVILADTPQLAAE